MASSNPNKGSVRAPTNKWSPTTGGGTLESPVPVDFIVSSHDESGIEAVELNTDNTLGLPYGELNGMTFLNISGVPAMLYNVVGDAAEEDPGASGDGFYVSTHQDARGVLVNVVNGYAYRVSGASPAPSSFSYDFQVTEEDYFDNETGFKLSWNQPQTGMITVNLYDLGVVADSQKLLCHVYNRTNNSIHTDWGPFADWGDGLFSGTAAVGDELTINIYGPWSEN